MMKITRYYSYTLAALLGLAAMGGACGFAADIQFTSFDKLATSSSAAAGDASVGPFLEEGPVTSASGTALGQENIYALPCVCEGACGGDGMCGGDDCFMGAPGRFWFQADYLLWWTSGAHIPPLVASTTTASPPFQTLFGDQDVARGDHDGYRVGFGMWIDCCHKWGVEGEYFDLRGRPVSYDSGLSNGYLDDSATATAIVRPFVDANGTLQGNQVANPTQFVGRVTVDASDYIQSAGLWLRYNLRASEWAGKEGDVPWTDSSARTFRLDFLGGYRFMRMIDSVNIRDDEMDVSGAIVNANNWTLFTNIDNFRAVNNFDGGELGLDATMTRGRWSLEVLAKAALGVNNQDVQLYNFVRVDNRVNLGGISQTSTPLNEYARNVFSWIPAMTLTGGYQLTDHVKFTLGYDIMYWSAVARAGSQIPVDPATGYPLQVNTQTFTIDQTWFWAEGLRMGGELRF
jgi:hypothetical protein